MSPHTALLYNPKLVIHLFTALFLLPSNKISKCSFPQKFKAVFTAFIKSSNGSCKCSFNIFIKSPVLFICTIVAIQNSLTLSLDTDQGVSVCGWGGRGLNKSVPLGNRMYVSLGLLQPRTRLTPRPSPLSGPWVRNPRTRVKPYRCCLTRDLYPLGAYIPESPLMGRCLQLFCHRNRWGWCLPRKRSAAHLLHHGLAVRALTQGV